jgi:serine kinase of HPr protein (carbohydrate metabolism regulator)
VSDAPTIHASAVLIGAKAALIRGPAGSGKSHLAWRLLGTLPFARLVADDRAHVETHHGRLLVRPAPALAGLIEIRSLGIRRVAYEPLAAVGLVVDVEAKDAERVPGRNTGKITLEGVALPRLAVAPDQDPLHLLLAFLGTAPASD